MSNYEFNALPFISYASFMQLESKVFIEIIQCTLDFCVYISNWRTTMIMFLISRSSTPLEVLFYKLMGNIYMNLEMCKHIFFVDFFIMSFLIIYNDLQSKKAKGKPTGFWALGSRLCLNFPLFCWCYIQNISHVEIFFFSTLLPLYISKEIM